MKTIFLIVVSITLLSITTRQSFCQAPDTSWMDIVVYGDIDSAYAGLSEGIQSRDEDMQCRYDQIPIPDIYNWICFPRLYDNASYDSDTALNGRIHPPVVQNQLGEMDTYVITALPGGGHGGDIQFIQKPYGSYDWEEIPLGGLEEVASHKGYVLMVDWANNFRNLYLFGEVLDPGYIFTDPLYPFIQNWVGYFVPATQSPFDAIATEFLDNITWMAGQNWFCHKETNPQTKSTGYSWRCACEQERLEIKYGEMIKIYPSSDIVDFFWQSPGQPPNDSLKMATEYYTYQEQASYEPFLIELDTNDLPLEIGAFAGDSCIGATKVDANDTLVLIRGFTEGYEGEPISFEMYYGSRKSSPERIHRYLVSTPDVPVKQHREIVVGDHQHWYDISFKQITKNDVKASHSWMRCSPNPFNNQCTIHYSLPESGAMKLEALDIYGKCVCILKEGVKGNGEYHASFSPVETGLKNGIYFIRLTGNLVNQTDKVVYIY